MQTKYEKVRALLAPQLSEAFLVEYRYDHEEKYREKWVGLTDVDQRPNIRQSARGLCEITIHFLWMYRVPIVRLFEFENSAPLGKVHRRHIVMGFEILKAEQMISTTGEKLTLTCFDQRETLLLHFKHMPIRLILPAFS
jgi:hypothetical protein